MTMNLLQEIEVDKTYFLFCRCDNLIMKIFENQVVVVAGAAQGIGAATSRLVGGHGGLVILLDRNSDAARTVSNEIVEKGGSCEFLKIDISSETDVRSSINEILAKHQRIDVLINAAGITGPTGVNVEDMTTDDFEKVMAVNLFGSIWLTQAVLPSMKRAGYGRIVLVSSIAGKEGNPGMAPYNVSKAGLIGFVKGVAKEAASQGVLINAVAPAVIRTPMNEQVTDEVLKYMIARIPVGRVGEAEEVAEMISFAASQACSFTTGFTFDTSGGRATY